MQGIMECSSRTDHKLLLYNFFSPIVRNTRKLKFQILIMEALKVLRKAVPKKILEIMKVPGITRENIASHLQKYRLFLKRLSGPSNQGRLDTPFQGTSDAACGLLMRMFRI